MLSIREYGETTIKLTHHVISVEGLPIHYQVVGRGEPIILVHGLSGSTRWWNRNVFTLAERYQVYEIDLPGFGSMRRFSRHFILTNAASWLLQWMEAIHVQQAHFIGHSMGGYICIRLAAHRPQAVRRLVLVSPAGLPTGRSLPGYFVPLMVSMRYMKPSFLPILFIDGLKAGPRTLLHAARDLLTQDVQEDLKLITAPTLLIWGENDALVPPIFGEILHKEIAHSSLHILKKAGHVGMFDSPHEFNATVLKFLAGEVEDQ